ncbi:MAG: hypothetical protein EOQ99_28990 [Mesorhizobium sp.]|nr:MAG: hypothetical protein EOQ56_32835 [Mesorhizobium sp.]RWO99094.1 MAG: hypothetical protein EOQ99_28990 [Mesorhizobium sp.]RWP29803.1 MAG: hypothetical protein EOR02_15520 [Mesorhizobium sp.]RWP54856.1 MAG: hypothetical protein EOR07_33710 [Mesorhizobium sp.]RWQ18632.1 MAG: hypothetical protein EOR92_16115 [Mesorhizobium sp.]
MFGFPQLLCVVPQKLALLRRRTFRDAGGTAPPSALPGISPTWGEIGCRPGSPISNIAAGAQRRSCQSPPRGGDAKFWQGGQDRGGAKDRQPSWFRARRIAGRRFHR